MPECSLQVTSWGGLKASKLRHSIRHWFNICWWYYGVADVFDDGDDNDSCDDYNDDDGDFVVDDFIYEGDIWDM